MSESANAGGNTTSATEGGPGGEDQSHLMQEPKNVPELTNYIQTMLQQMQDRFQTMSDQIISRIDDIGTRIDDIEQDVNGLMAQTGQVVVPGGGTDLIPDQLQNQK